MKRINYWIAPQIAERLEQQDKLSIEISQFLSLTAEDRIWPILKNHRLTLLTDDPQLALQARFQQKTLSNHLSKRLNLKISALHIKLISLPFASFEQENNSFQLSDNAAQIVRSIAQGITDSELQACLLQLVTTASTPRNAS